MSLFKRQNINFKGYFLEWLYSFAHPEFMNWKQAGYVKIPNLMRGIDAALIYQRQSVFDWDKTWTVGYFSEHGLKELVFEKYDALAHFLNTQLSKVMPNESFQMVQHGPQKFTLATHTGGVASLHQNFARPRLNHRLLFDAKI